MVLLASYGQAVFHPRMNIVEGMKKECEIADQIGLLLLRSKLVRLKKITL